MALKCINMNAKIVIAAVGIIAVIIVAAFAGLYIATQNNIVTLNEKVDETHGHRCSRS